MTYLVRQILWILTEHNDWKNAAFVSERGGLHKTISLLTQKRKVGTF